MFSRKELIVLTYHELVKLARSLNTGGYSISICKGKEALITNILNAFVVKLEETDNCSVRIQRIRESNKEI